MCCICALWNSVSIFAEHGRLFRTLTHAWQSNTKNWKPATCIFLLGCIPIYIYPCECTEFVLENPLGFLYSLWCVAIAKDLSCVCWKLSAVSQLILFCVEGRRLSQYIKCNVGITISRCLDKTQALKSALKKKNYLIIIENIYNSLRIRYLKVPISRFKIQVSLASLSVEHWRKQFLLSSLDVHF